MVGARSLILTLTRQCNLRCSYCPTAKDGWPVLTTSAIDRSIEIFLSLYGRGQIKLFGGEPFLEPELIRYVLEKVKEENRIEKVYVSTNGLGLNLDWIAYFKEYPKAILTISLDGKPKDHRRMRRAISEDIPDCYDHVVSLLPRLLEVPRLVITQTIAPATAKNAYENFRHLRELGFRRFNFLPGYFIPWKNEQLISLRDNFQLIAEDVKQDWQQGSFIYIRNLFIHAPTPFFNQGLIIDSDETIHPSNLGLSSSLQELRGKTAVGSLDNPPNLEMLEEKGLEVNQILQEFVPEKIWTSTLKADQELTRFCQVLLPHFLRYKKKKSNLFFNQKSILVSKKKSAL